MSARPATAWQLWRLNKLGLLGDLLDETGRIGYDAALERIAQAADDGLFVSGEKGRDRSRWERKTDQATDVAA
jgi:hypothetical protein